METVYTVVENKGQVEVCVHLIHPPVDILDEIVCAETYNYKSSIYIPPNAVLASELPYGLVTSLFQNISLYPAPDSPNFLGIYPIVGRTDYEEQLFGINRIRDTVINETRRLICYNQTIYDDVRLEPSEYAGLALAVSEASLHTVVEPMYDQLAIHILDDDGKLHLGFILRTHQRPSYIQILSQCYDVNRYLCGLFQLRSWVWTGHYTISQRK